MNKTKLLSFVSKYHLGGNVEPVKLESINNTLITSFITDEKNVIGKVTFKDFKFEETVMPVYTTSQLVKMISILGDNIELSLFTNGTASPKALIVTDGATTVNFTLAEPEVIPKVPPLKSVPAFEVEIKMDDEFIDKFIKSKNALADVNDFALIFEKGKAFIILGYSKNVNTDKISIGIDAEFSEEIPEVKFSSKYLKEILSANKGMTNGKLKISSKGLAHVTFESDMFETEYFLIKLDNVNS